MFAAAQRYYLLTTMLTMSIASSFVRPASCFSLVGSRLIRQQKYKLSSHINDNSNLWYEPQLMDHMMYRIKEVNNLPHNIQLINFTLNGQIVGKVTPKVAHKLCSTGTSVFELSTGTNQPTLTLSNSAGTTVEQRTKSVGRVMQQLYDEGYITGWRDELYPVSTSFHSPPLFLIERAASSLLGILEYGVHINGIVKNNEESNSNNHDNVRMWMARRSQRKDKFPGFLDHIVAGGQGFGLSLMDNVIKECYEEAGIPPEITRQTIQPVGAISYENFGSGPIVNRQSPDEGVMNRVVLFCFDLTLPQDFVPTVNDGEVENFFQWSLQDIAKSMDPQYDDPIKPNCYPGKKKKWK